MYVVCFPSDFLRWLKPECKKLQQDFENDPIIRDQMANLTCLLVCIFGNVLASASVTVNKVYNIDLDNEQNVEIEGYESD